MPLDLNTMGGHEFEDLVENLLVKMGFATEGRKPSADGGIDIVAVSSLPLVSGRYIIQCKRYGHSVSSPIIRDLYGVVSAERANKGILITTSAFTSDAIDFARDKPIELIDGNGLIGLLGKYGLLGDAGPSQPGAPIAAGVLRVEIAGLSDKFRKELVDLEAQLTLKRSTFGDPNRTQAYKNYGEWTQKMQVRIDDMVRAMNIVVKSVNEFQASQSPELSDAKRIRGQAIELFSEMCSTYSEVRKIMPPPAFSHHQQVVAKIVRDFMSDFTDFIARTEESLEKGGGAVEFKLEFRERDEMAQAIKEGQQGFHEVGMRTAKHHRIRHTGGLFSDNRQWVCSCGFRSPDRGAAMDHLKTYTGRRPL